MMNKKYIVIKNKNSKRIEFKNIYFKYCIQEEQVYIVITTYRKYAYVEYDFNTLNNAQRHIKSLSECNIADKVRDYAEQYASKNHLPSLGIPKSISDVAGGFEIFIEDCDKVGNDMNTIIDKIMKSGCIQYETKEEMIAKLNEEELDSLKKALGEEYFK